MNISGLLDERAVILNLQCANKWDAINLLLQTSGKTNNLTAQQIRECNDALIRRENVSSTYVGNNIAFPHATVDCITSPLLCIGVTQQGVLFDGSNNQYAKIIVLLVVPQSQIKSYSGFLSKIAQILIKSEIMTKLLHCVSARQFIEIIKSEES